MALPCAKDVAESSRASTAIGLSCILGASLLTIQVGSLDFGPHVGHNMKRSPHFAITKKAHNVRFLQR